MRIGPKILYSNSDNSDIYGFPDLSKILDFSEDEGTFSFSFRKFQTINTIFYMKSDRARGGQDLLMISCVIRISYFKNELIDIYQYLESKNSILENFAAELKVLPNFNLIRHNYSENPTKKQFTEYCKEQEVDFFTIYNRYFELIFSESEIRIITQDINLSSNEGFNSTLLENIYESVDELYIISSEEETVNDLINLDYKNIKISTVHNGLIREPENVFEACFFPLNPKNNKVLGLTQSELLRELVRVVEPKGRVFISSRADFPHTNHGLADFILNSYKESINDYIYSEENIKDLLESAGLQDVEVVNMEGILIGSGKVV